MKKAMIMTLMLIGVGILFGAVFFLKWYKHEAIGKAEEKNKTQIFTVSSAKATTAEWKEEIDVVGSSRTVKGVNITTELAGMITKIDFAPGINVEKGKLLVQLNIAPEVAQLHKLQADEKIAEITYHRDIKQYKVGGVSKETVDQDEATYKSTSAQVAEEIAIIAKKTIRAPFSGRIGVRLVNPGEYLNPGTSVTNLQTLKPIYIDFYVPQASIPKLRVGQTIKFKIDAYAKETFNAAITTINPVVDESVRNILVEATYTNNQEKVLPGMYTYVTIKTGEPKSLVTLPQMGVTFNPYGNIVYLLTPTQQTFQGKKVWKVHQQFVTTGDTRGNQIAILKGVKVGDSVVTSGQLKIKNDSLVVINNKIQPADSADPSLTHE